MKNKVKRIMSVVGLTSATIGLLYGFSEFKDIEENGNNEIKSIDYEKYFNYDSIVNKNYYTLLEGYSIASIEEEGVSEEEQIQILFAEVEAENSRKKLEEQALLRKQEEEEKRKAEEAKKIELAKQQEQQENTYESDWTTFNASYYTSSCKGCSGTTRTGIDVRNTIYYKGYRIVAVDPKVIPLGSIVEVKTPHETFMAYAGDTGGAIKRYKLDILVSTKKEAYTKGRHDVQLRIVSKAK